MKGYYVDENGRPLWWGARGMKRGAEGAYTWVDGADGGAQMQADVLWDGAAWVPDAQKIALRSARAARRTYALSVRDDLPIILDAIVRALTASGAIDPQTLPVADRQAWQRWRAAVDGLED